MADLKFILFSITKSQEIDYMDEQNVYTSQETAVEKDTKSKLTNRQREFAKLIGPATPIFSVNAHCLTSRYLNQMF